MIESAVSVLIYAAAIDLYTRYNMNVTKITYPEVCAMLRIVDWPARPFPLEK